MVTPNNDNLAIFKMNAQCIEIRAYYMNLSIFVECFKLQFRQVSLTITYNKEIRSLVFGAIKRLKS